MLRIVVKDILKIESPEKIILKTANKDNIPRSKFLHLLDLPEQIQTQSLQTLNDKNYQQANLIDGIFNPNKPQQEFIYIIRKNSKSLAAKTLTITKLASFGILFIILINFFNILNHGLILRNHVIANAESAYSSLIDAAKQAQHSKFKDAGTQFQSAQNDFNSSLEQITFLNSSLSNPFGQEKNITSLQNLLSAGQEISQAGVDFSKIGINFSNLPQQFINFNKKQTDQTALTDKLHQALNLLNQSISHLDKSHNLLSRVNSIFIPKKYQKKLTSINSTIKQLLDKLHRFQSFIPSILKLIGDRYPYRYLVLLQNDSESRATGGFIGSYLIVDLNDGRISKITFHDVYDSDGLLTIHVPAPEEIAKITNDWGLRDSNYSPNFDISGEKAAWFLQKSKGPSVDAVIAINQSFLKDLLNIYGPISVKGLQKPLTADNYQLVLSYFIESKFFGASHPKKILSRTIDALKEKIFTNPSQQTTKDYGKLLKAFIDGIKNKKIMLYARDPEVQKLFDYFYFTPRQINLQPQNDYLQINAISIGGNKTDQFITQNVEHQTFVKSNGQLFDEITIKRTNQFNQSYLNGWKRILKSFGLKNIDDNVLKILGNSPNKDNLKIYLPLGTTLDNAIGIDPQDVIVRSDPELHKTFFLFPMNTAPGKTSSVTLRYKLPYRLKFFPASIYRFTYQTQPGITPTTIEKTFSLSPNLKTIRTYDSLGLPFNTSNQELKSNQNKDFYLSTIISS